jgi:hypothetical protein
MYYYWALFLKVDAGDLFMVCKVTYRGLRWMFQSQWESGGVSVNLIQEKFSGHVGCKNKGFAALMQGNNSEEAWVRQF